MNLRIGWMPASRRRDEIGISIFCYEFLALWEEEAGESNARRHFNVCGIGQQGNSPSHLNHSNSQIKSNCRWKHNPNFDGYGSIWQIAAHPEFHLRNWPCTGTLARPLFVMRFYGASPRMVPNTLSSCSMTRLVAIETERD